MPLDDRNGFQPAEISASTVVDAAWRSIRHHAGDTTFFTKLLIIRRCVSFRWKPDADGGIISLFIRNPTLPAYRYPLPSPAR